MTAALLAGLAYGVLLLGALVSALVLLLGQSQSMERLCFVAAILVVAPLGVTLSWREAVGKGRAPSESTLELVAVTRLGLAATFLCLVRLLHPLLDDAGSTSLALCFLLLLVAVLPLERWLTPSEPRNRSALLAMVPLLLGLAWVAFVPASQLAKGNIGLAAAAAIIVAFLGLGLSGARSGALCRSSFTTVGRLPPPVVRASRSLIELSGPMLIGLLVFFRSGPNLGLALEQNYFLGPTSDVLHGHAVLVGTFSQYGFGMFDALALLFSVVTPGYGKLTLLIAGLTALMYAALYVVLRASTRSVLLATVGAALAAALNVFGSPTFYTWFPSTGVLRFGFPWLVLLSSLHGGTSVRRQRTSKLLMLATVAVAAVWSGEAGVYTLGTAAAVTIYDAALAKASGAARLRAAARAALLLFAVYFGSLVAFTVLTWVTVGSWPNWGYYIDYIRLYTIEGFGTLPIGTWSPGLALGAVYLTSFIALGLVAIVGPDLRSDQRVALRLAAGLTAFGALSFTYFLGRAAPQNLLHIAPPGVALVFVWLGVVLRANLRRTPQTGILAIAIAAVAAFGGALIVASQWSYIGSKLPDTALAGVFGRDNQYSSGLREMWNGAVVTSASAEVKRFARMLGARSDGLTILTTPYVETEALLLLGTANAVGTSNPCQESFSTAAPARLRRSVASLPPGGIVIFSEDPNDAGTLLPIQEYTLHLLQARFGMQQIGTDGPGLKAFRMTRTTTRSPAAVPAPPPVPISGGICG